VGTAGYHIDIGDRDPEKPGRYLLAVECDGAMYHSSQSARDRDRLRQAVLEGLGWRFHRIWSTDWFRNPFAEKERLINAIKLAQEESASKQIQQISTQNTMDRSEENAQNEEVPIEEYFITVLPRSRGSWGIHEIPSFRLAEVISEVVKRESPVHIDQVTRRILDSFGVNRAGGRIRSAIAGAIRGGTGKELFLDKRGFLYTIGQTDFPVRRRSELEAAERKISYVALEEIDHAILTITGHLIDVEEDDLVSEVLSAFGFKRATKNAATVVQERIFSLKNEGILVDDQGKLRFAQND